MFGVVLFMDIVYIRDLRIDTIIGVFDWERKIRQTISIDLEMATDIRPAAATDDIQLALNYNDVSQRLIFLIENSEFELVETMAETAAKVVREEFNVPWLKMRLSKPGAILGARDVGLIIERGEKPVSAS